MQKLYYHSKLNPTRRLAIFFLFLRIYSNSFHYILSLIWINHHSTNGTEWLTVLILTQSLTHFLLFIRIEEAAVTNNRLYIAHLALSRPVSMANGQWDQMSYGLLVELHPCLRLLEQLLNVFYKFQNISKAGLDQRVRPDVLVEGTNIQVLDIILALFDLLL